MPLLGKAAMLLNFDIVPGEITEHDDWHTHEHFPERLSIPGFLRGTRWIAEQGRPRYFVMYEVEGLEVLASAAYLERLNNPTPWTQKMMTHYRGMTRGLCRVTHSFGAGLGHVALLVRFKPAQGKPPDWLHAVAGALPQRPGLASAHLFESGLAAPVTSEQRIRGKDAGVDCALLVTGYSAGSLAALADGELSEPKFRQHGAEGVSMGAYRTAYSLTVAELT
jgi:hypothetical protein